MASWRCVGHCGGPSPRPTSSRPRGLRATSAAALALAASLPPPGSFPPWSQPKPDAGSKESASKGAAAEGSDRPFTFPALPTLTIPGLPTVPPGTNAGDLIAPALAQALLHLLKSTGSALHRLLDQHLASLHGGGYPATAALLRAYLVAGAAQLATLGLATQLGMLDRAAVCRGQLWRLVTWGFLHAGPLHLMGNYAALAHMGPQLEALAGTQRFTMVYGGAAAAATVASLALNGGRRSLGASGAVFGVAAALARYHSEHAHLLPAGTRELLRRDAERDARYALLYHVLLWSRLDVSAHVGGAAAGWVIGALLGPSYVKEAAGGLVPWVRGPPRFRDKPRLPVMAERGARPAIPFPIFGPGFSIGAAAVPG